MRVAVHHHGSANGAAEVVADLAARGVESHPFAADLLLPDAPRALVDRVAEHFGAFDVLVNSAATMDRLPFELTTPDQWDRVIALNLRAPFFLSQAAARHMREEGAIVNIADLAAFETWPGYLPHGVSKSGVVYLTRALARVLAPRIRVNAVAPGVVLLPVGWDPESAERLAATTPLRRVGSADDVAHAVIALLANDYVTGTTITVDGGRRIRR